MSREAFTRKRVRSISVDDEVFHIRPLTGAQLEKLTEEAGDESLEGVRALGRIVCFCACDENGERLFSDDEVAEVMAVDIGTLRALGEFAIDVSGLGDDRGN